MNLNRHLHWVVVVWCTNISYCVISLNLKNKRFGEIQGWGTVINRPCYIYLSMAANIAEALSLELFGRFYEVHCFIAELSPTQPAGLMWHYCHITTVSYIVHPALGGPPGRTQGNPWESEATVVRVSDMEMPTWKTEWQTTNDQLKINKHRKEKC